MPEIKASVSVTSGMKNVERTAWKMLGGMLATIDRKDDILYLAAWQDSIDKQLSEM